MKTPSWLLDNTRLVQDFQHAVNFCNIGHIPKLVRKVLETGAWRERVISLRPVTFGPDEFHKFITGKPPQGCNWEVGHIEALLKQANTDYDILVMWRRALIAPHGTNQYTKDTDNVSIQPEHGNSIAYTLDRLERERPDLYARTLLPKKDAEGLPISDHLSANAAAIQAGFRKPPDPLDTILRLLPKLTPEQCRELFEHLHLICRVRHSREAAPQTPEIKAGIRLRRPER
jgi:hypothetical protein